ncbi:hypothetical protein GCM10023222_54560 [Saccharopolyspora cebuensis]
MSKAAASACGLNARAVAAAIAAAVAVRLMRADIVGLTSELEGKGGAARRDRYLLTSKVGVNAARFPTFASFPALDGGCWRAGRAHRRPGDPHRGPSSPARTRGDDARYPVHRRTK